MITIDNQKQCTKCKEFKPATNEFFVNQKGGALGLRPQCKVCGSKRHRKWYEANRERHISNSRKWYEANSERKKEADRKRYEENPEPNRERSRQWYKENQQEAREGMRKYYEANKERMKENCRKWKEANPERHKELGRKWLEANPEKVKELGRKWREANPEKAKELGHKWRKANPEKVKELGRKWRKENPEKVAENRQQRRALKANAAGTSTAEQIKARFYYYGNSCYYCGDSESGLHVEHRIPLSRGGSNWPANLVPACPMCNLSKHTKTEKEFLKA